jgi:NAD-dependent DNA ligase
MADSIICHACSSTEQRFLEASMAYQAGKPIVSDEEYDQLKRDLRMKNSMVIQQVHIHPT